MAIVTGPLHSSEARGSVGALVYNTYHGHSYVKARSTPTIEYSDLQITTRALMVDVIAFWRSISALDRGTWSQFSQEHQFAHWTGTDKRLTPWAWFARCNFRLKQLGEPMISTPPYPIADYSLKDLCASWSSPTLNVIWTPAAVAPDPAWYLIFWLSHGHKVTVHPTIKLCHRALAQPEQDGAAALTPESGYFVTLYAQPVSLQGIPLTPTPLTIAVP
jgi:hypothetical protein